MNLFTIHYTLFRKRLSPEMIAQINQLIIAGGKRDSDDADLGSGGIAEETQEDDQMRRNTHSSVVRILSEKSVGKARKSY